MPTVGEIRTINTNGYKQMWQACGICGTERWVEYDRKRKQPTSTKCRHCTMTLVHSRDVNHRYQTKGGRSKSGDGYYQVRVYDDDFFASMRGKDGYVLEHRLVMARHLGRCLQNWEVVHHKNGIRNDNHIENLELTMTGAHIRDHHRGYKDGYQKGLIDGRERQIAELREQIRIVQLQNKQLMEQLQTLSLNATTLG